MTGRTRNFSVFEIWPRIKPEGTKIISFSGPFHFWSGNSWKWQGQIHTRLFLWTIRNITRQTIQTKTRSVRVPALHATHSRDFTRGMFCGKGFGKVHTIFPFPTNRSFIASHSRVLWRSMRFGSQEWMVRENGLPKQLTEASANGFICISLKRTKDTCQQSTTQFRLF